MSNSLLLSVKKKNPGFKAISQIGSAIQGYEEDFSGEVALHQGTSDQCWLPEVLQYFEKSLFSYEAKRD